MEPAVDPRELIYTLSQAETFTVTHTDRFEYSHPVGRSLYAFIYISKGCVDFNFKDTGNTVALTQGQVIYIPKGTRYSVTYQPEQAQTVLFQFDIHEFSSQRLPAEPTLMPPAARRLFHDAVDQHTFSSLHCAAKIYELLALLQQRGISLPQKFKRLLPAVEELQRDPTQDQPVAYYAALCHMSVPGFRRSFKEYTGQSPVEFRNELRLLNARKLIAQQEYSVEAAARISGFTNLSFFYRLFRRKFGTNPGHL